MKVFCDTNVLLDVLALRVPFYEDSARLWSLAEAGRIEGVISAISPTTVFYVIRRLADRRKAWQAMRLLRDVFSASAVDQQILNQAVDAGMQDFEDAVQLFSALRAGAVALVTRDPKHYPADHIPIQTPAEFLAVHFPEGSSG
jgi:predicted nucleic acid-binding protein